MLVVEDDMTKIQYNFAGCGLILGWITSVVGLLMSIYQGEMTTAVYFGFLLLGICYVQARSD